MRGLFDRDKAREVLIDQDPWTMDDPPRFDDALLDRLEECVQPPRAFVVHSEEEFRGRIDAEAKLARIAQIIADGPDAYDWPVVGLHRIRAVLDGGAA